MSSPSIFLILKIIILYYFCVVKIYYFSFVFTFMYLIPVYKRVIAIFANQLFVAYEGTISTYFISSFWSFRTCRFTCLFFAVFIHYGSLNEFRCCWVFCLFVLFFKEPL